jgi:hypothetical protein
MLQYLIESSLEFRFEGMVLGVNVEEWDWHENGMAR